MHKFLRLHKAEILYNQFERGFKYQYEHFNELKCFLHQFPRLLKF